MFRFLELSLHGWDLWPPVRLPLDREVVLLTGPNGSGKTTLLDAVRQILNAPRLSSRRRLQGYLRRPDAPALIRAVVSNDPPAGGGPSPFRRERITTPEATLACALLPGAGGAPEKRFAVLPGRPPLDEVRRLLLESRDWYGPERYQRALENAGVTRSLMSVLAIEQGRTNALFELRPRELFRRVLEMLGDHAVLERYTEARRRFGESEGEVVRQTSTVQKLQMDLRQIERQIELLDDWERRRERVAELEARLPAAELQVELRRAAEASAKLPELRTKVRRGEAERAAAEEEAGRTRAAEERSAAGLAQARRSEEEARARWEGAHRRHVLAAERRTALEALRAEAAGLPPANLDLADLAGQAEAAVRSLFAAEAGRDAAARTAAAAREVAGRLRAGLAVHPPPEVDRTLADLARRGIVAALLGAPVGPASATTPDRDEPVFGLLAEKEVAEEARSVALDLGFPGPVYTEEWTAAGLEEAEARLRAAEAALEPARRRRVDAESALATERRRRDLLARAEALPAAQAEAAAADEALARAAAERDQAAEARESAHRDREAALAERTRAETQVQQLAARLRGEREALERTEAELAAAEPRRRELADRVPPELRARAERGELDGPDTVNQDLQRASRSLADLVTRWGEPPPPQVREEAVHLRSNVEEAERHLSARRREAEEAQTELAECRRRYLDIIGGTLQDYRRRAAELAAGAEVEVEMDLPRLIDDDRALDEAALQVRFGFDGKDPLPLGDPSFSGGQQVIAGLVLLMAMAETDGRGFFLLDEPFAHLSLDRVDQVGRFLRAARAQFLLTAPTTLDRAQLDPASLVIVLQKKRAGEPHAPVPIVAEA